MLMLKIGSAAANLDMNFNNKYDLAILDRVHTRPSQV